MEAVVLLNVGFLEYFCPKQGQDFKPSAAPLYPNIIGILVCLAGFTVLTRDNSAMSAKWTGH